MSHPWERLSGKSEGGANQAPGQKARDKFFVVFFAALHNHFFGNCYNPDRVQDTRREEI